MLNESSAMQAGSADRIEREAAAWLAQRDGGARNAQQESDFEAWLQASTAHRVAWLRLDSVWRRADKLALNADLNADRNADPHADLDPALKLAAGASVRAAPRRFSGWRMAAAVALTCAAGAMAATFWRADAMLVHATALGENKTVALSEGSRITLNTATRLRTGVGAAVRQVVMERGEAYFNVAPDRARPFVIQTPRASITVLGTRFAVRIDGAAMQVLVEEGSVRVAQDGKEVVLGANGSADLGAGRMVVSTKSQGEVHTRLGWREGRLILDQMSLGQAAAEFNRYNQRKIVVTDPALAAMGIGGSFAPTNVDGFARLLEQGFGLRVERGGADIKISR